MKDTRPYNTWKFHGEQTRDRILAYAVELTGRERGKIRGNLYELDYAAHFRHVREQALPADIVTLFYERGERSQPTGKYFSGSPDPQYGEMCIRDRKYPHPCRGASAVRYRRAARF